MLKNEIHAEQKTSHFCRQKSALERHVVLGLEHKNCAAKNPTFVMNNSAENA